MKILKSYVTLNMQSSFPLHMLLVVHVQCMFNLMCGIMNMSYIFFNRYLLRLKYIQCQLVISTDMWNKEDKRRIRRRWSVQELSGVEGVIALSVINRGISGWMTKIECANSCFLHWYRFRYSRKLNGLENVEKIKRLNTWQQIL